MGSRGEQTGPNNMPDVRRQHLRSLDVGTRCRQPPAMRRRHLYPMPIAVIADHPEALTLPAAGFGMLARLCLHFWATECRPLPKSECELRSIARVHSPAWNKHKAAILRVFEDWRPSAEAYYRKREGAARGLKIAARNGGAANAARLRLRALELPPAPPRGPIVPQTDQWRAQERALRQPSPSPKPRARLLD